SVRMLIDQVAYRPAILPARDRIAHRASVGNRLLEGFDPAVIAATEERDPGAPQVLQQDLERLAAGGIQGSPALGLDDDQSLGLRGRRGARRNEECDAAPVGGGESCDFEWLLAHAPHRGGGPPVASYAGWLAVGGGGPPLGSA